MNTNTLPHFTRFGALMTLLLLPAVNHADEVPLQSFEWDPMNPALWVPGSINNEEWLVQPGTGTVAVTETDAHSGAQSILFSRGLPGTQARLDLQGHLPLAEILPAFVDCWVRPASFSTYSAGTYAPPNAASGTQIFVDGHWFCFLSQTAGGPLRLHYHNQLAEGNPWVMSFSPAASIPLMETPPSPNDVVAADWVRFTCRVDPATQRADVWLNGRLVFTDVPRSDAYASFPAPSFYMQGSSHGPQGFDDFQSALTNPLFGDMDADGLPDDWEQEHSLNVSVNDRAADPDGDGLNSLEEFKLRTRPDEDDTDADGIPDGWEIAEGLNPLHDRDAWQDFDLDGADNLTEYLEDTDPNERLQSTVSSIYVRAVDPAVGVWWSGEVGTWDEPFSDLAGALALLHNLPQSSSGPVPTIVILPDSYSLQGAGNTNLTISRDVNIQGNGAWMEGVDTETYYPAHWGFNIQHASVTFESFSFYGCWGPAGSAVYAAGYYRPDMKLVMRNCWFYYCGAVDKGGAIRLFHVPSATFENCGWDSCYANDKGGAFSAEASAVNIQRSKFYWNYATGDGGGLHLKGSTGLIENCLFDGNTSEADGGAAVFKNGTDAALRYVTAVGNGATGQGAAFYNSSSNAIPLTGSILWGNGISPIASNTQATGLWSVRYTTAQQQLFSGPGNSVSDPLLVEWISTLKPGSPAIDTGDPTAPPAKDCDGNPRKHAPGYSGTSRADRGCFEFSDADGDGLPDSWEAMYGLNAAIPNRDSDYDQDGFTDYEEYLAGTAPIYSGYRPPGAVFYVHPLSGNDANNGSFSAPVKTISRAIALCNNTTTARICLRDGTYTGSLNKNLTTNPGGVAKKFYLRSINGKGRVTIDLQDSGRFLIIENPAWDGTCGLEGLTIRRGKVWYESKVTDPTVGAGILVRNTSAASQPFIARCTFSGCEAIIAGGAIYVGNGSLFLFETELFANRAYYGGALSIESLSGTHTVFGLNCTLAYNWAPDGGGGAISSFGRMQWKGGAIFGNTAAWGGAVAIMGATASSTAFNSGTGAACRHSPGWPGGTAFWQSQFSAYTRPLMSGTRIADNDAWSHGEPELPRGGAISIIETTGEPAFESLVLENNRAAGENYNNDGGAVCSIFSSPAFTACIFRGNQTVSRGGAIYAESIDANGAPTALANCALCENEAASEGGAIAASPWFAGRNFSIYHTTITRNTSPWHVISTADGDEYWTGNWAELRHCLIYYNRTPTGAVSPVAPSTLAGTTYPNAIENPAASTTANNVPALAWDGYHLINPSSIPDPALPPPTGATRDIDSELRVSGNPAEYGCDEWTDSNGDGIPDWYVQMLMRLFPNAGITLMTDNLASRLLWGPDGPSIRQVYDYGLNPGRSPLLNDADGDGITDAREILELNTSPTNIGSTPGLNLTDAQKADEGAEVDSDNDGAKDDAEALPLDNDFRWPKAPEYQYVAIPLGENTKALGVTPEGKVLLAVRTGTGPYTWALHIVDQASPLTLGPALPPSETTNRTGFANSQWPLLISRTTGFPRLAGGQPLVLDRFLDSTSQTSDYRTAVYSSSLAWVNTAITVGPAISIPPARPAGLGPPALPQQGALPEWLTSDSHLMGVAPLQFPIINASQSISSPPTASGFMLVRWELTGAPPIEFTGLYEPAPLPCYTHGYSPFFDNNGAQSGTAAVSIYRDVSEIGNVLYQPGTETLHPPQYLYRRATGTREAVSQPPFHTVDARSIHELPAPAPSDTAFIKGPVLAGAEPDSNLDTLWLWEEQQAPFSGLMPKRVPVYSGTEKTYLQVSDVRDISDRGEMIVGFEQMPSSDTRQIYNSIWRNGRTIPIEDLAHLDGYDRPEWQGVGYGKHGVLITNLRQIANQDGTGARPMRAVLLVPIDVDVDSDNTNDTMLPDRSTAEEKEERDGYPVEDGYEAVTHPGKIIKVNDGDADHDAIPDFADNCNLSITGGGVTIPLPDFNPLPAGLDSKNRLHPPKAGAFYPIVIESSPGLLADATIEFRYRTARFTVSKGQPGPNTVDGYEIDIPPAAENGAALRVWKKPFHEYRNIAGVKAGGDYIETSTQYTRQELGLTANDYRLTLYVEALSHSQQVADAVVTVTFRHPIFPNGKMELTAKMTAISSGLYGLDDQGGHWRTNQVAISNSAPSLSAPNGMTVNGLATQESGLISGNLALDVAVEDEFRDTIPPGHVPASYPTTISARLNGVLINDKLNLPGLNNVTWTALSEQRAYLKRPFPHSGLAEMAYSGVPLTLGNNCLELELPGFHGFTGRLIGSFWVDHDPITSDLRAGNMTWAKSNSLLVPYAWGFRGPPEMLEDTQYRLAGQEGALVAHPGGGYDDLRFVPGFGTMQPVLFVQRPRPLPGAYVEVSESERGHWERIAESVYDAAMAVEEILPPDAIPTWVKVGGKNAWMFHNGVGCGITSGAGGAVMGIVELSWDLLEGVGQLGAAAASTVPLVGWIVEDTYTYVWGEAPSDAVKRKADHIRSAFHTVLDVGGVIGEVLWKLNEDGSTALIAFLAQDEQVAGALGDEYMVYLRIAGLILKEMNKEWENLRPFEKGYYMGRAGFELASLFIGPAAVVKLSEVKNLGHVGALTKIHDHMKTAKKGSFFEKAAAIVARWITKYDKTTMCFIAGTPVMTPQGFVPIEDIQAGDMVISRGEAAPHAQGIKQVLAAFVTHPSVLYELTIAPRGPPGLGVEILTVTGPHPFYVSSRVPAGFVPAAELQPGDVLSLADGGAAEVADIAVERAPAGSSFTAYNFEVADYHTYFAGRSAVWVHNSAKSPCDELFAALEGLLGPGGPFAGRPWEAFDDLTKKMGKGRRSDMFGWAASEVMREHMKALPLPQRAAQWPSHAQIRTAMNRVRGGSSIPAAKTDFGSIDVPPWVVKERLDLGDFRAFALESHHGIPREIQQWLGDMNSTFPGLAKGEDSVPAFLTTMLEHRGANRVIDATGQQVLVGLHQRLAKKLGELRTPPTGPVNLNQGLPRRPDGTPDLDEALILRALEETYTEAGLAHFWKVCEYWLLNP